MKIQTIALVAPSGTIEKIEDLESKIGVLEKSFKVKRYFNPEGTCGYLADTDDIRTKFFEDAFTDDEVDLVLSLRGGFGALRIVDKINYDLIKNSNKIYSASSDATILLLALNKKTNVKCFHSLMLSNGFVENLDCNIEIIENEKFNLKTGTIRGGCASGYLWGGNLSSIVSMFSGDAFLPERDIILFLEDIAEPLYKIDKMLFEILRNKKLKQKIKGIIFGDFYIEKEKIRPLFEEYAEMFDVPCFLTDDITHKPNNVTLPVGQYVKIS